jgi:hypothetical protein
MALIKYLLIVFAVSLLIAGAASWLTNKGLQKSHVDFYGKMNAASDTTTHTKLVIIGSSRALVHFDTRILDSVTGLASYNYGLNAASIKTCFNTISYVLHYQKQAKLVLLNIDYNLFDLSTDPYKDAYYYPFEKNMPGFLTSDNGSNKFLHRLTVFDISLYDDYTKYAALDGWLRPHRKLEGSFNGYTPNNDFTDFKIPVVNPSQKTNITLSDSGFKQLNDIINLCKKEQVQLALLVSPYYKGCFPDVYFTNYYSIIEAVKQTAIKNKVVFIDYSALPSLSDKKYFYNCNHLNTTGAGLYTAIVADTIHKFLKDK